MKQSHEATADSLRGGGTLSGAASDRQTDAVSRPKAVFAKRRRTPWKASLHPCYASCRASARGGTTCCSIHRLGDGERDIRVGFDANVSRDGERHSEEPALELAYVSSSEVHDHCAADNGLDRTTAEKLDPADDGSGQPGQQLDQGRLVIGLERNVGRRASARQTRTAHRVRGSLDSKYANTVSAVKVHCETDKQGDETTIRCRYTLKRGPRTEG